MFYCLLRTEFCGGAVMIKFVIGLLVLLAACVLVGIWRKFRGGPFLPPPTEREEAPLRNLADLHNQRKKNE